jgi:hypothetical protein
MVNTATEVLLELVELPTGEMALTPIDGEGGPVLSIRFSDQLKRMLGPHYLQVARNMMGAGLQGVSQVTGHTDFIEPEEDHYTLH